MPHGPARPSLPKMAGRALRRRCPWCGGRRAWFAGWFKMRPRCRTCGYRWERQPGFSLGATTMNTIVTFGLFGLVILVGFIATYPDIATVPILVASVAIAVVVPIVFYPFSYTLWACIDLAMRPLEPDEQAENAIALAMEEAGERSGP